MRHDFTLRQSPPGEPNWLWDETDLSAEWDTPFGPPDAIYKEALRSERGTAGITIHRQWFPIRRGSDLWIAACDQLRNDPVVEEIWASMRRQSASERQQTDSTGRDWVGAP